MRSFTALALAALALAACQTSPETGAAEAPAPAAAPVAYAGYTAYGVAPADTSIALPAADIVAAPQDYTGRPVVVSGVIREVCQSEGCWFTFHTDAGQTLRVKTPEDSTGAHAFVLPKDISGRRVLAEGTLVEQEMSAAQAEHMRRDAEGGAEHDADEHAAHGAHEAAPADTAKAPAGSELRLTATGVLVKDA